MTLLLLLAGRSDPGAWTAVITFTDSSASPVVAALRAVGSARQASPVTATLQALGTTRTATDAASLQALGTARQATPGAASIKAVGTGRQATPIAASIQAVGSTRQATPVTASLQAVGTRTAPDTATLQATGTARTATPVTAALSAVRTATPVTAALQTVGVTRQATPVTASLQVIGTTRTATPVAAALQAIGTARQATPITASLSAITTATRTAPTTASLQATGTARTATESAALQTIGTTRTAPATASIAVAGTRTAPTTASLQATGSRTAPTAAALSAVGTRTAPTTATLQALGSSRTAPETATLQAIGTARQATPVTATASLVSTRTAPTAAALQTVGATRTAPTTASLQGAGGLRTAPTTAALKALGTTRTAPTTASLQSVGTSRQATNTAALQAFTAPSASTVTPAPGGSSGVSAVFVWRTAADPTARPIHSRVIAAASAATRFPDGSFAAASVDAHTAYQSGFEYDTSSGNNGAGPWIAYPASGLTVANHGRQARYTATIPAGLTDWRVRLESVTVPPATLNIFAPAFYWTDGMGQWTSLSTGPHPERRIVVAGLPAIVGGGSADSTFTSVIDTARAAGVKVLGYVHASYGSATQAQMISDSQTYQSWYNLDGIFLDETICDASHLATYTAVADAIRVQPNQLVVFNPGGTPTSAYFGICDKIMTFEDTGAAYASATIPAWLDAYKSQCIHAVHTVALADWAATLTLAQGRSCSSIYITDDIMPNAYHLLPTYWSSLTAAVET